MLLTPACSIQLENNVLGKKLNEFIMFKDAFTMETYFFIQVVKRLIMILIDIQLYNYIRNSTSIIFQN